MVIYITGRPDMQKEYVLSFLGTYGFPLGLVACADTLSTDSHIKTLYLGRLIKEVSFTTVCACMYVCMYVCNMNCTLWSVLGHIRAREKSMYIDSGISVTVV